jgi:hypothetical protein
VDEEKKETTRRTPLPVPDPDTAPVLPDNLRWPLEGKTETPTVPPKTAEERRRDLAELQKRKRRRGFLIGLVVGQLLVVALVYGGEALLRMRPDIQTGMPLRFLVFLGVVSGLLITALIIALLLGLQGIAWLFKRGKPFGVAARNGIRRVGRALLSIGVTLAVLGGTAAATIPPHEWKPQAESLWKKSKEAYRKWTEKAHPSESQP